MVTGAVFVGAVVQFNIVEVCFCIVFRAYALAISTKKAGVAVRADLTPIIAAAATHSR